MAVNIALSIPVIRLSFVFFWPSVYRHRGTPGLGFYFMYLCVYIVNNIAFDLVSDYCQVNNYVCFVFFPIFATNRMHDCSYQKLG